MNRKVPTRTPRTKVRISRINGKARIVRTSIRRDKNMEDMIVMARPSSRVCIISSDRVKDFIKDSKNNVVSKEFLEECKESAKLIKKGSLARRKN